MANTCGKPRTKCRRQHALVWHGQLCRPSRSTLTNGLLVPIDLLSCANAMNSKPKTWRRRTWQFAGNRYLTRHMSLWCGTAYGSATITMRSNAKIFTSIKLLFVQPMPLNTSYSGARSMRRTCECALAVRHEHWTRVTRHFIKEDYYSTMSGVRHMANTAANLAEWHNMLQDTASATSPLSAHYRRT